MSDDGATRDRVSDFGGFRHRTVTCYVVGYGSRGSGYAEMAVEDPGLLRVTGIAEPSKARREAGAERHSPDYVTETWEDLLERPKLADFVIIATQDSDHAEPAIAFMKRGFHVLVEKPMATTPQDCVRMARTAEENNVLLGVCHVLRYTPYTSMIRQLVKMELGEVRSVNLVEPIGNWHFAHSYVRGNWRNSDESSPLLMAKSCHDVDWLRYIIDQPFKNVVCCGSQFEFTRENKPKGAASRCTDCKVECAYNAVDLYVGKAKERGVNNDTKTHARFPYKAIVDDPNVYLRDIEDAVATGPYGRCVYECDNNQPDVVSAIFTFESAQATLETRALTENICKREVTICCTDGEIRGDMENITVTRFKADGNHETHKFTPKALSRDDTLVSGHWGADWYMLNKWCAAVDWHKDGETHVGVQSGIDQALGVHLAVFAAETARQTGTKINIPAFVEHETKRFS